MFAQRKYLWIVGAVVIALGVGGWLYSRSGSQTQYQTASVERGSVQASISATGNTNAVVTVQVGSQVSGNIKALYADFNTKVKKGQLVAQIDPQVFQARVDQARASLDSANSNVVSARAQIQKAEADIASARAALANQQASVAKSKAMEKDAAMRLKDRQSLAQQGIISKEDLSAAQSAYDEAIADQAASAAQVDAANHQIQATQAQRDVANTQLTSAQSQVKQAQAGLQQAQLDLDHTNITAPVEGTVIARHMDVGQTVAASFQSPTIFEIAQDLTKMQVDTNVDESDVGVVRVGQEANFTVDAYPTTTFQGAVRQIRQAPINVQNVVTYDIVVGVSNDQLKLFPGMTASVKILTKHEDNVLKIPNAALRYRPATAKPPSGGGSVHAAGKRSQNPGQNIWIMGPDGQPKAVRVKLGSSDGSYTTVESGDLKEGEQIIVGATSKGAPAAAAAPRGRGPGF